MTKPITPKEAKKQKQVSFPPEVINTWNNLIVAKLKGSGATISEKEAVAALVSSMSCTPKEVYERGWLDIESTFQAVGWKVKYDKPGFNETYEATFEFTGPTYRGSDDT